MTSNLVSDRSVDRTRCINIHSHTKSEWFARVFGEHEQPCLYKEGLDLTWDKRGRGYSDRQLQKLLQQ